MKIKFTLLLCSLLITGVSLKSFAQALYPVSTDEKVSMSALIAEGTVVNQNSFWNTGHTMIYTANKIKLHKIFKGFVAEEFIEVLTQGGTVGNESIEASDLAVFSKNETGMFFCNINFLNLKNPLTGELLWDVYSSSQGFIRYDLNSKIADAPFANYSNIVGKLYPAITERTGTGYIQKDAQFIIGTSPVIPQTNVLGITSFSPANVAAGATANAALNLLTITGTDFGTASGTAAVLFDDANNGTGGTAFTVLYSDPLVVSWTNTQIQVRVPSRAGTGTFQVRDAAGNLTTSPGILNVIYSVLTASFTGYTAQANLMNDDAAGGYTLLYSTSTAGGGVDLNASATKSTFQRALNTWKQVRGFNVTEGGTTATQQINPSDGLNVAMFDNTNTGNAPLASGVLAVCYSFNSTCNPLGSNAVRKTEFDIVLRNTGVSVGATTFENGPCYPAQVDIDFESVILHELGHALNLGHINDDYQYVGGAYTAINPGKLMHYAVLSGVARKSLDWSAFTGASYCINPKGLTYGTCVAAPFNTEMIPLAITQEAKDECPGSFPAAATANNTAITFDLEHATSNKNVDPQYTAINCTGGGTNVSNTAFYAIKTNTAGTLTITVNGYATSPASQAACSNAGVELALYQVSNCPTGQAYPAPVACRSFTANGAIPVITGLLANTNYLIFLDGMNGTKANFNLLLNGTALPVKINFFDGIAKPVANELQWELTVTPGVSRVFLESSDNSVSFKTIYEQPLPVSAQSLSGKYSDVDLADKKYYRLKILNGDGSAEYSEIVLLRRETKSGEAVLVPNPVADYVNIITNRANSGKLTVAIMDITGKKILTKSFAVIQGTQTLRIDGLEKLAPGNYILQINDQNSATSHKLIKR